MKKLLIFSLLSFIFLTGYAQLKPNALQVYQGAKKSSFIFGTKQLDIFGDATHCWFDFTGNRPFYFLDSMYVNGYRTLTLQDTSIIASKTFLSNNYYTKTNEDTANLGLKTRTNTWTKMNVFNDTIKSSLAIRTPFIASNTLSGNIIFSANDSTKWTMLNSGVLQSNGAQTIQTSSGNLTIATVEAPNNNIVLQTHATNGSVIISPIVGTVNSSKLVLASGYSIGWQHSNSPAYAQYQRISAETAPACMYFYNDQGSTGRTLFSFNNGVQCAGFYQTPAGVETRLFLGAGIVTPTYSLSFAGTAARTMGGERNTVANQPGYNFTMYWGSGATSGSTDKNAGSAYFATGEKATGNGGSDMYFQTITRNQGSGTTDRTPTTKMVLYDTGDLSVSGYINSRMSMSLLYDSTDVVTALDTTNYRTLKSFTSYYAINTINTDSSITIPTAGYYEIHYHCSYSSTVGSVMGSMFVNDVEAMSMEFEQSQISVDAIQNIGNSTIKWLPSNAIIKIKMKCVKSGNITRKHDCLTLKKM